MGYIASGKGDSAKVETGGAQIGTEGYFIEPTIFSDVKPEMKIAREEIFGPVAAVFKFTDDKGQCTLSPCLQTGAQHLMPFVFSRCD